MSSKDRLHGRKTLKVGDFLDEFEKDDIKKTVDIVSLFGHFGVELKQKGKSFTGLCPWHEDRNPSLSVDRDKGLYNCFGCGESGDVFTLVEKMKGTGFKESAKWLKEFAGKGGTGLSRTAGTQSLSQTPSRPRKVETSKSEPKEEPESKDEVNRRDGEPSVKPGIDLNNVADYYHKRLLENPKALEYLKSRGLDDNKLIARFQLGFADGSLLEKISDKQKETLKEKGIITEKNREHFGNCITFPIVDDTGQVVGLYGRALPPKSPGGGLEKKGITHLYLKGNHKGVFNHKAASVYDEIILTESIIDALSLIALGIENVQALYGTNGFTDEHLKLLKDNRVKTVVLAFDNDQAGRKAAEKLSEKLLAEGFSVKAPGPPKGGETGALTPAGGENGFKDWNDFLTASGTTGGVKAQVVELIDQAEVLEAESQGEASTGGVKVTDDAFGYLFTFTSAPLSASESAGEETENDLAYRVSGVKELFLNTLKVAIRATLGENSYYDTADLYSSRSRDNFSRNMSRHFDVEPARVEKHLVVMLEHLEAIRDRKLDGVHEEEKALTREEVDLGMELLTDPKLFDRIVEDMEVLGYVGEDLNKQLLYIAATSRKLDDPISVLIISQSASGKSMLVDTVKDLMPPEDVISATSLSDQALNYVGDMEHKFLSLSEAIHNEVVEHQLREMQSAKELSRLVTMKDAKTGKMESAFVATRAVVSIAMSSTRHEVNPENASRSFVIDTDESKDQTRRIHEVQRGKYTLERYHQKTATVPQVIARHHAAQRLLAKRVIVNSFGKYLSFPDSLMRTRRDNDRFMDLIACVAFMRQFQKEVQSREGVEYITCDIEDYRTAYEIMVKGVLSSTMLDMPSGTIELYDQVRELARKQSKKENLEAHEVNLTQREIREHTGLGQSWIKQNLRLLVEYEYLIKTGGRDRGSRAFYRLREDAPIQKLNLSMIPSPEEVSLKLNREVENE